MKRKVLVLALVAMFMVSIVGTAFAAEHTVDTVQSPFTDVADNHATVEQFALLNALQIFEGYGDGTVGPQNTLTRSEFAKVVVAAMDRKSTADALSTMMPSFTDAATIPVWARGWVNASEALGLVIGRTDGTFDPMAPVTFAEAATMLVRVLGYEPAVVGPWPGAHIAKAAEIGLTEGLTIFYQVPITREEMAIMTANALDIVRGDSDGEEDEDKGTLLDEVFGMETVEDFNMADFTFGASVALFGAADLDAIEGAEVKLLERGGVVVFIKVVELEDKVTGVWTTYRTVSQRITVGGTVYNLQTDNGDADVTIVINDMELPVDISDNETPVLHPFEDLKGAFDDYLKDEVVTLTFNDDGEVEKIEAWLDTYEDTFLVAVETDTDEEDFGTLDIYPAVDEGDDGKDLAVDEDTRIWLNGEMVTLAELEDAFDDFQAEWDSALFGEGNARPIVTARTLGNCPHAEAELLYVWVWTENIVTGEVTSIGATFVRVDGVSYNTHADIRSDLAEELGKDVTLLLDSEDRVRDILDTVVVEDIYFAKLDEVMDDDKVVVELADGTTANLSDVELNIDGSLNDYLGTVIVVTVDIPGLEGTWLHDVHEAKAAGAITATFGEVTETSPRFRIEGAIQILDEDFFVLRSNGNLGNFGHIKVEDEVMVGKIDGIVGYIVQGHVDPAVDTFELTITSETGGTTDPAPGVYTFVENAVVDLEATAVAGYLFDGWTGPVANPNEPNTTVTMTADKAVEATFVPTYTVFFTVVDEDSAPIEGAEVELGPLGVRTTNAAGQVAFQAPDGPWGWEVSKDGYDTRTGTVVVDGAPLTINVTLELTQFARFEGSFTGLPASGFIVQDTMSTVEWVVTNTGNAEGTQFVSGGVMTPNGDVVVGPVSATIDAGDSLVINDVTAFEFALSGTYTFWIETEAGLFEANVTTVQP